MSNRFALSGFSVQQVHKPPLIDESSGACAGSRSRGAGGRQCPVDRCATNTEALGDLRRPDTLRLQFAHLRGIDGRWPPLVDARFLRLGDALELALLAEVGAAIGAG